MMLSVRYAHQNSPQVRLVVKYGAASSPNTRASLALPEHTSGVYRLRLDMTVRD